jgi:formylglycine-generating enzyme required for sulfatase activity
MRASWLPLVLILFGSLFSSNAGSGILVLEKSTNGFASWQKVPITSEMLTSDGEVDIGSLLAMSNGFYRMKISVDATAITGMVRVVSGTLPQDSQLSGQSVPTFYLGKYEVTLREWQAVQAYAAANGYDLENVGVGTAPEHPVQMVNWYDAVKWCNAKSQMEGLSPVYFAEGNVYKTGQTVPVLASGANGYRLPTEAEWEWAARGGSLSQGHAFSGNNEAAVVAWFLDNNMWPNVGTKPVGLKSANELRTWDMSGNVAEWCGDSFSTGEFYPSIRGGGFDYPADACIVSARGNSVPHNRASNIGFRVARTSP